MSTHASLNNYMTHWEYTVFNYDPFKNSLLSTVSIQCKINVWIILIQSNKQK